MRIIFMGTPDFAVPSLEALLEGGFRPICVATGPDRPRGRGRKWSPTPVKRVADAHGIPTLQPESVKDPDFAAAVSALEPDVIVVVAYRILPPAVYEAARLGAFNLHASLLPAFRGAAPINRALMAGATETGVTTFFLKKQVDTGDVILQERVAVSADETAGELHDRLMVLGAAAVLETVRRIERGAVETQVQDDRLATPAPKIHTEDAEIAWERPAKSVHDHVRGLSPYPGAWTRHEGGLLKLYRTRPVDGAGEPGRVIETRDRLVVACGVGAVEVLELQQEGRQRLPGPAFLRGYRLETGAGLG